MTEPSAPTRCPSCGSRERDARKALAHDSPNLNLCPDAWHRQSEAPPAEIVDGELIHYTRHAESSLDGCDPKTCQIKDHWFYEVEAPPSKHAVASPAISAEPMKRWTFFYRGEHLPEGMSPRPDGKWVKYDDAMTYAHHITAAKDAEIERLKAEHQKALRAFYDLFGRLGLTMICEATLEECLTSGIHEIDALQEAEARCKELEAAMTVVAKQR